MSVAEPGIVAECAPDELAALLPAISLADLNAAAELQTRTDRKYILDPPQLLQLILSLAARLAVLEIHGQRIFDYESVYFDTPDLESFRSAAHKRRKRFKVRTRSYLDSQTTMVEVKTRSGRGVTVKRRQPQEFERRAELNDQSRQFVDSLLERPGLALTLTPVLTTTYARMTLVDVSDVARLTVDASLQCTSPSRGMVTLDEHFVVETKSGGSPSVADRQLWAHGIRPTKISKFGTGLAALDSSLPSNKWNRTLRRYFR